jgi:hypothetical protein
MEGQQPAVDPGEPLFNQKSLSEYLGTPYTGPVPEVILYRLLSATDGIVRAELERQEFEGALSGLAVGYYAPKEDDDELGEFYQVGCGRLPEEDVDDENTDTAEPPDFEHPLSVDFIDRLAAYLEEEMRPSTPPGHALVVRVYGTLYGSFCCWGLAPCPNCGGRKGYYYGCGSCRIWCSGSDCR